MLDQILSDAERERVLENIHSHLQTVAQEIREGKVPIEKFIIDKSLTKAPEDYADAKAQPHVQVAMRMKARGQSARAGDTIPYVVCVDDEDMSKSFALRSYHPDDLKKSDSQLKIDFDYYLNIQIHPPVARLCRPIDGTDDGMIASCLGLDPSKFRSVSSSTGGQMDDEILTLHSQISDKERFRDVLKLTLTCRHCNESSSIDSMTRKEASDASFYNSY